jgi:hypothetical protein
MPRDAIELYEWMQEEMESEGQRARNWGELDAGAQIAWGKLYRRLMREHKRGTH